MVLCDPAGGRLFGGKHSQMRLLRDDVASRDITDILEAPLPDIA